MHKNIQKILSVLIVLIFLSTTINTIPSKSTINKKSGRIKQSFFDLKIKLLMKLLSYPSVVACIIKNDSIVWKNSYDKNSFLIKDKTSIDTIYGVGSISKSFTATAIMQIIENESYNVNLDDDVNKYLPYTLRNPKYPDENITVRMLLKHESSINDLILFSGESEISIPESIFKEVDFSLEDILLPSGRFYNSKIWNNNLPGEKYSYSSVGYALLGFLIECITNISFEKYCQKNIFSPLNMKDTSFNPDNLDSERIATPHSRIFNICYKLPNYDSKNLSSAMGLRTTIEDLSHFFIAHINNGVWNNTRLLNESSIDIMHTINPKSYNSGVPEFPFLRCGYGIGWGKRKVFGQTFEGHTGGIHGYTSYMICNITTKTGVIYFANQNSKSGLPRDLYLPAIICLNLFKKAETL